MGRPGAGGGGSHHSSGGHSSSRSSGGHHVSSSRPLGGGNSYRPSGSSGYHGSNYNSYHSPGYHNTTVVYNNGYGGYYGRRTHSSPFGTFVALFVIVVCLVVVIASNSGFSSIPASTINRTPIESSAAYQNDCVVDETGWVENVTGLEKGLKHFYEKTGVQPYILLKEYDSSLVTDADKEAFANKYYDENIGGEDTFLYVYFCDSDPDEVGYMCYVNGKRVSQVMDSEAVEIFWAYIDNNWYSDKSMTDVLKDSFNDTADTIMKVGTTKADVGKTAIICVIVIAVGVIAIVLLRMKHKRAHQEAEETAKILNTPLSGDSTDDLVDKYTK